MRCLICNQSITQGQLFLEVKRCADPGMLTVREVFGRIHLKHLRDEV